MLSTEDEGRDLHNFSHHTKAEFNDCFIIHSKCFQLPPRRLSSNLISLFLGKISGYKSFPCRYSSSLRSRRLEVVGTRKNGRARRRHVRGKDSKVYNIHRAICLAIPVFLPFRFSSKFSYFVFGFP